MGNASSHPVLQNEMLTWSGNHSLEINPELQRTYIKILENNFEIGEELHMRSRDTTISPLGIEYLHYFITTANNPKWTIEFGGGGGGARALSDNTVTVHSNYVNHGSTKIEHKFFLTPKVMERIQEVVGATGYSLALRNCEHVARYIHSGAWVCNQMTSSEKGIGKWLLDLLMKDPMKRYLNKLPVELAKISASYETIVPGLSPIIEFHSYAARGPIIDDAAYNIVVIGPTGSGKSAFINRLFNKEVCKSSASAAGVTREFATYTGTMEFLDGNTRNVNVIDSIGFCDSSLEPNEVCDLLKQYLKNNTAKIDKLVVLTSGRIEKEHAKSIKQIMKWLNFKWPSTKGCFLFIYNKADTCDEADRVENVAIMASALETGNFYADQTFQEQNRRVHFNMPLGIPQNAGEDEVQASLDTVRIQLDKYYHYSNYPSRITVDPGMCAIL